MPVDALDGWGVLGAKGDAAAIAARLIAECTTFDLPALASDPLKTLSGSGVLKVEIEQGLVDTGCGGGGYYRPTPPTIHLHPATSRRDNFTLLHELGHHLQQTHDQWGFTLIDMADGARLTIEEQVSDQIAAQILMPVGEGDFHNAALHPADVMSGLFARSEASRSAVVMRVLKMLPSDSRWILAVADVDGTVISSASSYTDPQPPRGFLQEGFARVASEATYSAVRREFHEGIEYKTGALLDDLWVEGALDYEERYVFLALRPTTVSRSGTWTYPLRECSNPACEAAFDARQSSGRCESCQAFKCPRCKKCTCSTPETSIVCDSCFMVYSRAEMASGTHECW
ncbi:ImmA/IrrE family metallo-endopeptidase [Dietzia sp. 179-F 9C3 NHS]|uniref:ImmA/IrrE family metallo-endopeptidase n=1 Tax=Dietzia sp. 179-F 9C3 NHS TaxID=3374295 RepID=UPI00387A7060